MFFRHITSTVQKELILTLVPTSALTQYEDNVGEILNSGMLETCTEFQDKKISFLDSATAVADIDFFCS